MAFMRYANAQVIQPAVSQKGWSKVRKASMSPSRNLVSQASEILGKSFSPDDYLLTHCFPAGHKVLMADGTEKPIEDIEVGDFVITHKGNVKAVTNLLRKLVDEDLTVIKAASLPEVACTSEHPFYVIREADAWCRVYPSYQGQVKCTFGGKQVCEKNSCWTNGAVPDWVDARDVRVGDRTYTPTLHRTQVSADLNPNRMRVLGYYVAEGRVDKDHNGRFHSIRFSIHEDEIPTLGAEIARLMRMEFGVSTHSIIRDKKRDTKCVTLSFCSHEHAPWFLRHAGCGSRTKRLSPDVVWSPVDWQRQLVGAWINGDGCYDGQRDSGSNGIRLSTSSDDLASQAVVLLDRMGVHSRLQRVRTKGREYKGRWIKGTDGWHVEVSASYLLKLSDVVHLDVVGTAHKRLSTKGRYRYAASTLSSVESVERRPYKGTVYNLSVQDDESYIVNRQAVHNCTIVASVDVDPVPNVKLGRVKVGSKTINRKFPDFHIKPECSKFVNNNGDSWSREVLLASYPTFIGAHNFCFAPGTGILLADGTYKPIEDVEVGDRVVTHTGVVRPVTHKFERDYEGDIHAVRFDRFKEPILVTGNHPFRGIEVSADPIRPRKGTRRANTLRYWKDQVVKALRGDPTSLKGFKADKAWIRADQMVAGSYVLGPERGGVPLHDVSKSRKRSEFAWWGNCRVHRVASNETLPYAGKVYNIEVEGDHSYVVGHGIAVHNCEHVQIEEQSRGRIIDAVARDIGDSVYIDILVATDRQHTQLVKDIESGEMGTLSMGCFIPGTMVSMADGTRVPIEEVQPGDMVLTHKGRAREVLNKQIRGVENGVWETRTIHAVGLSSPITATDNHPFYVLRAAEVCACGCGETLPEYAPPKGGLKHKYTTRQMTRRFKVGHDKRILNPNGSYSLEEYRERQARMDEIQRPQLLKVRADELRVGDFIAFPRVKDGEHTVEVSEGKARLLGYFLAEGSFNKRKGRRTTVVFSFSMEEKETYVAEVCRLLEQEFPGKNNPWVQDRSERNTCVVHLTNRKAADWFYKHGGEYSHGKRLSVEAMNWSVENHRHLIGAWINGDGTCAKAHNGFLSGTTVSLDLASQMHGLMAKCGWFARYEARIGSRSVTVAEAVKGGVAVRDETTGRLPAYTLVLSNTQSVGLQGYSDKAPTTSQYDNQNFRTLEDWTVAPITEIESGTYEGWVHDMEVEEDHTYVVEGAVVSNCSVEETICTKCGNVAIDETDLCDHIKYEKLNTFYDEQGNKRIVAELCGHKDLGGTCGVTFIEASWVATPAFTGAVMRNILEPAAMTPEMSRRMQTVLNSLPPEWSSENQQKAASLAPAQNPRTVVTAAGWGDMGDEDEGGADEAPAEDDKQPIDKLVDEVYDAVRTRVKDRVDEDLRKKKDENALTPEDETTWTNDTVIKEATAKAFRKLSARHYKASVEALLHTASHDISFVEGLAVLNNSFGIALSRDLYRTALRVGSASNHETVGQYLEACRTASGRPFTPAESRALVRIGTLLTRLGSISTRPSEE